MSADPDYPIPDDLVNKVGAVLAIELGHTMLNPRDGIPGPNTARIAREALAALAEWADGGLIDPETWEVMDVRNVRQVTVRRYGEEWDEMRVHDDVLKPMGRPLRHDERAVVLSPREQADG